MNPAAPVTFAARYYGSCAGCPEQIVPGVEIQRGIDGLHEHVECPVVDDAPVSVCQDCWLARAANGSCGCS